MFQYHCAHLIYICICTHLQTKLNTIYTAMALFNGVIREHPDSFRENTLKLTCQPNETVYLRIYNSSLLQQQIHTNIIQNETSITIELYIKRPLPMLHQTRNIKTYRKWPDT